LSPSMVLCERRNMGELCKGRELVSLDGISTKKNKRFLPRWYNGGEVGGIRGNLSGEYGRFCVARKEREKRRKKKLEREEKVRSGAN
jgi:hypothetical protein